MGENALNPAAQTCLQQLMRVWFDFERRLNRVPIIARLEKGAFDIEDYKNLLLHMRQQVVEGSRWITRSASSFDRNFAEVRSIIIGHAKDEHKDYQMIERDFVACGGDLETIQMQTRNVGSEALHGYLMYRASQPNPIELVGAMWMIEGLGQKMALSWADRVDALTQGDTLQGDAHQDDAHQENALQGEKQYTQFLRYHGLNDQDHMEKFYEMLDQVCTGEASAAKIVKTAQVVGRLYCLQLEEIDETRTA